VRQFAGCVHQVVSRGDRTRGKKLLQKVFPKKKNLAKSLSSLSTLPDALREMLGYEYIYVYMRLIMAA
jgi:hypothetical protein